MPGTQQEAVGARGHRPRCRARRAVRWRPGRTTTGQVNHAIVASLVCFAALQAGAPFGYLDWLGLFALAALGNMIGGIGLVTVLRLLQAPHKVAAERRDR